MGKIYETDLSMKEIENALNPVKDVYRIRWNPGRKSFSFKKRWNWDQGWNWERRPNFVNVHTKCKLTPKEQKTLVEICWMPSMNLLEFLCLALVSFVLFFCVGTPMEVEFDILIPISVVYLIAVFLLLEVKTKLSSLGNDIYEDTVMAIKRILQLREAEKD